jgi:DNA-nicking Smr family endonuclease
MGKKRKEKKEKPNKYDNLSKPQAEFDFHDKGGLRMDEVRVMADEFIEECRERGLTKVLFITGKGLHSKKGMPVIKPFLKKYLLSKDFVLRVYEGRFDRGGTGTLEVVFDF